MIVDLIHITERLRDAAWCFYPRASPSAGGWVRARAAEILDGRAAGVAAALRDAAASLGKTRRKIAEKTAGYLEVKAPYMDYPRALAAGWPIATGVIEGACRHLVKDRMDITGARWGVQTAEAILQLRALTANGDFDAYSGLAPPTRARTQPPSQQRPRRLKLPAKETHPSPTAARIRRPGLRPEPARQSAMVVISRYRSVRMAPSPAVTVSQNSMTRTVMPGSGPVSGPAAAAAAPRPLRTVRRRTAAGSGMRVSQDPSGSALTAGRCRLPVTRHSRSAPVPAAAVHAEP